MMIALSDNLCTNLVIQRMGLERIDQVFKDALGLKGTRLQRKLMDLAARERGLDNWITAADCIRCFELVQQLSPCERNWVEPILLANQDSALLMRDIPRDTVDFYHKTGSLTGLFHDWGYTRDCEIFLLTNQVKDELAIDSIFGQMGQLILE
jgi:beta-lactamase class A